jgi:type IV secretory pathway VirB10-like protein
MNTIWLKIAAAAVVVVIVIIVAGHFTSNKPGTPAPAEPPQKQKTFYDMADRDKQFNEAPKPVEEPAAQPAQEPAAQPAQEPTAPPAQPQPAPLPPPPTMARPAGVWFPSDITSPMTLYFKRMSEEDDIAAQQILPYATAGRSIGRLPIMQYGFMMKACRQIEERWPDSWYAFRAKQMMEEITQYSDRYAKQYNITPQELDISRFLKPRQGLEPRRVEPIRR